jgi:hypothetical protein
MTFLCLIPVFLSLLLLAAHLLRWCGPVGAIIALAAAVLLAIPQRWAARIVQILLVLAALEWVRTGLAALSYRQATGEPWLRMVIIIGAVAVFTAASALVFQSRTLRDRYGLSGRESEPPG